MDTGAVYKILSTGRNIYLKLPYGMVFNILHTTKII